MKNLERACHRYPYPSLCDSLGRVAYLLRVRLARRTWVESDRCQARVWEGPGWSCIQIMMPERQAVTPAGFAEVQIDADFGTIHVTRVVSSVASGRILNPKTARYQVLGSSLWDMSMELEEESVVDHTFERFTNLKLEGYHVPVKADVHDIEVIFVEGHDAVVNPLGVQGLSAMGVLRRQSPTPFFMRPANAPATCQSPSTSCCEKVGVRSCLPMRWKPD